MSNINSFQMSAIRRMANTKDNNSLTLSFNSSCELCCRRGKARSCPTCAVERAYLSILHMDRLERVQLHSR